MDKGITRVSLKFPAEPPKHLMLSDLLVGTYFSIDDTGSVFIKTDEISPRRCCNIKTGEVCVMDSRTQIRKIYHKVEINLGA